MERSQHTESSGIDAVLFDLDDTLLTYRQDPNEILETVFERTGIPAFCTFEDLQELAVTVPDRPGKSHEEVWVERFRRAAVRTGHDPCVARILYQTYGRVLDRTEVCFRPGAQEALCEVPEHVSMGIVTNGERTIQEAKLSALGLRTAFDVVVCSDDVKKPKPAAEPFEAALSDLDAVPEDSLYVGDAPAYDVRGAKDAGLLVIWWPRSERVYPTERIHEPHFTVRSGDELCSQLASLFRGTSEAT